MNEVNFICLLGQHCLIAGAHRLGNTDCFTVPFPAISKLFPQIPVWHGEKSQHGNCSSCNCNACSFQSNKQLFYREYS